MKRHSVFFTFVIAASMLLAACSGGGVVRRTPAPGGATSAAPSTATVEATPTLEATAEVPGTAEGTGTAEAVTPTAEMGTAEPTGAALTPAVTGTAGEGGSQTGTPTTGDETATPPAGGEVTGTPTAGAGEPQSTAYPADATPEPGFTPAYPVEEGTPQASTAEQYLLLSKLVGMTVQGQNGQQAGTVQGVVVDKPAVSGTSSSVNVTGPRVSFLLMDTNASSGGSAQKKQVLVPWKAIKAKGKGPTGSTGGPSLSLSAGSSALQNAPAFDAQAFNGQVSQEVNSYWSGQVAGIPTTGAGNAGGSILIRGPLGAVNITDPQGGVLGKVSDLMVDSQTGEITYAILSSVTSLPGRTFLVPMNFMDWTFSNGQAQSGSLGGFTLKIPGSLLSQAPSAASIQDLLNSTDWNSVLQNFLNSVK